MPSFLGLILSVYLTVAEVAATEVPKEDGNAPEFVPVKAQEALAKAKYMLHGGAPTAKELRALGGQILRFHR